MEKEKYNGFDIRFNQKTEYWYALVNGDGKPDDVDRGDNHVSDLSLKKLKEKLDLMCRNKFARMKVFVRANNYRYGGGRDKEYLPQYTEATMTSISPNGNAYVVRKGEKHGEKHRLGRYSNDSIVQDTPQNRKIIAQIESQGKVEWAAEIEQERLKKTLKMVEGSKLYKTVYGAEIN